MIFQSLSNGSRCCRCGCCWISFDVIIFKVMIVPKHLNLRKILTTPKNAKRLSVDGVERIQSLWNSSPVINGVLNGPNLNLCVFNQIQTPFYKYFFSFQQFELSQVEPKLSATFNGFFRQVLWFLMRRALGYSVYHLWVVQLKLKLMRL